MTDVHGHGESVLEHPSQLRHTVTSVTPSAEPSIVNISVIKPYNWSFFLGRRGSSWTVTDLLHKIETLSEQTQCNINKSSINFPNVFFAILHSSSISVFIYYRCKYRVSEKYLRILIKNTHFILQKRSIFGA